MRAALVLAVMCLAARADDWQKPDQLVRSLPVKRSDFVAIAEPGVFLAPLLSNRVRVVVNLDDPKVPERSVDVIILYDVLHGVDHREPFYMKLRRVLRPGGRIVNIDLWSDPPSAASSKPKLNETQVVSEFKAAGFRISQIVASLPYQYVQVFE